MADCFVRVVHDFEGNGPEELSVKQGDVIKVIQYLSSHWLDAELHGNTGLVPVIYTEKLKDASESEATFSWSNAAETLTDNYNVSTSKQEESNTPSQVEALYDFQARSNDELSFPAGAWITVTADVDDVWFEGIYEGKTGVFPKTYVDARKSAAKPVLQPKPCAHAIYPFVGESDSELTFKEGQVIFLRQRSGSQWMIGELDGKTGLFPASFVNIEVELPTESNLDTNAESFSEKKSTVAEKVQWVEGMKARVLYHFTALYSEDLELKKGDLLTVISVMDDVWIKGQLISGRSGLCPSAYLEPVLDDGSCGKQVDSKAFPQLSTKLQGREEVSDCGTSVKKMSTGEETGKSASRKSLSPLDTSISEDPNPFLKPVCAVSPIKRTMSPTGQKPALKPKPVLGSPKRANSLSAKSRPALTKSPDGLQNRKSFSLNRGGVTAPSGVSEFSFDGLQWAASAPRSPSSNKASLLDDTPTKDKVNLPSPLSALSPGATGASPSKLAPPKRRAPPPPRAKNNSKTDEVKSGAKQLPGLADNNARAASPRASMQGPAAHKQQATVLPNSHKQDSVSLGSVKGEVPSGRSDSLGVASSSAVSWTTRLKESLSPPTARRSTAKSRPTSVLYVGGESASQGKKRLSSSLEDLRIEETEESVKMGATRICVTQQAPISSSELPELEQMEKDIAKTEDQLQVEIFTKLL